MRNHDYDGQDRRAPAPQGWHLDKKVPISIILTMIGIAGAGMSAYGDLKRDIELIKADNLVLHQRSSKQDDDLDKAIATLQAHYTRMDAKLDRLIERVTK